MIRKPVLQVGVSALLVLIVWNGYVVVRHVEQTQRLAPLTLQSSVIQAELLDVLKDVTDMEAGQRGYLLTNNPSYLQPYMEAKDKITADFAQLRTALANRGDREQSLELQVESLVNSKRSEMERSITLRKEGFRHRAFKLVESNEATEYMDNAREDLSWLSMAENSKFANLETERNAGLRKILKESMVANLALLALAACLFILARYHGRVLEQDAARSAQQLASHDFQLAKLVSALSNEVRSKMCAIEVNARLLLREYGGFLPRHAHQCAEQIQEVSSQLEQLRKDLVGNSHPSDDESTVCQAAA